jgi:hypothetical protein
MLLERFINVNIREFSNDSLKRKKVDELVFREDYM